MVSNDWLEIEKVELHDLRKTHVKLQIATLDGAWMPKYHSRDAVAFDFAANQDVSIGAGGIAMVPTGLIVKPDHGYYVFVAPRGSLHKKGLMLANNVGIIDPDYCGPTDQVFLPLYNLTDQTILVKRGDRLAQGILTPYARAMFEPFVPEEADRGGFGSTGQ